MHRGSPSRQSILVGEDILSRIRMAATAAMVACGLMLVGGTGVASAQTTAPAGTPLAQKVALTGTKGFKGTFTIDRFISKGGKVFAVGTVTGKATGGKKVTKNNVQIPATLTNGAQAQSSQIVPTPNACTILNLV